MEDICDIGAVATPGRGCFFDEHGMDKVFIAGF